MVAAAAREINQNKYARLLAKTLPVVVKTEEENEAMLLKIEELMDKGDRMTPEELALVELMTELVEAFEDENYQIEDAEPHARACGYSPACAWILPISSNAELTVVLSPIVSLIARLRWLASSARS